MPSGVLEMKETEYLFCEWTDLVGEGGRDRIRVREKIKIGEDFWRNLEGLTKVELFSSRFKPASMRIQGENVVGIGAENRHGENFFFALLEDVAPGAAREIRVWLEGRYAVCSLIHEVTGRYIYKSNFAWIGPHLQRLSFPKGYEILSVQPEGGEVGCYNGRPTVAWRRAKEFWGEIEVKLRLEE
jgi:hypothetical protein